MVPDFFEANYRTEGVQVEPHDLKHITEKNVLSLQSFVNVCILKPQAANMEPLKGAILSEI